jgi:hypothetical protein
VRLDCSVTHVGSKRTQELELRRVNLKQGSATTTTHRQRMATYTVAAVENTMAQLWPPVVAARLMRRAVSDEVVGGEITHTTPALRKCQQQSLPCICLKK